jgi:hypothetical protein
MSGTKRRATANCIATMEPAPLMNVPPTSRNLRFGRASETSVRTNARHNENEKLRGGTWRQPRNSTGKTPTNLRQMVSGTDGRMARRSGSCYTL